MIATLTDIAETIFAAVISLNADVNVTAGRPPAPESSDPACLVVNVWAARVTDENQLNDNSCHIRGRLTVAWEAWSCYSEPEEDPEDAARLYDLAEAVWCALVTAVDDGHFGGCERVALEPAVVQPRQGGAVSMLGTLTVPFDCS